MLYHNTFFSDEQQKLELEFQSEKTTVLCSRYDEASGILRHLCGVEDIKDNEKIDEQLITHGTEMPKVGYLFRIGALLSNLSLQENISLPYKYYYPEEQWQLFQEKTQHWLELFRLNIDLNLRPALVSPSVQKVVSYIRTILMDIKILCADDPLFELSYWYKKKMVDCLTELKESNFTMIIGTNDLFVIEQVADVVLLIDNYEITQVLRCDDGHREHNLDIIKECLTKWWL